MSDLLLSGGRPWGLDGPADILVRDGAIERIAPGIAVGDADVIDVSGRLVLPGLVDALEDRIANDRRRRGELGIPSVDRIVALLERIVAAGTSHVRSHTDIDPEVGLRGVEAVRAALRRLDGRIGVEQVAFPQHGLLINPGTAELLDEALQSGVETIGGIDPAGIDRDPVRHLDVVFDLAARHRRPGGRRGEHGGRGGRNPSGPRARAQSRPRRRAPRKHEHAGCR